MKNIKASFVGRSLLTKVVVFSSAACLWLTAFAEAAKLDPEVEETLYYGYYERLADPTAQLVETDFLSNDEIRILFDATEAALVEGVLAVNMREWMPLWRIGNLPAREQVRWFRLQALQSEAGAAEEFEMALVDRFTAFLPDAASDVSLLYEFLKSAPYWRSAAGRYLMQRVEESNPEAAREYHRVVGTAFTSPSPSPEMIRDLFFEMPPIASHMNGAYAGKPRLFLFCRHNRVYPCLFVFKDRFDQPMRRANGDLWTQPALAHSSRGLPFNQTNGYTPQGVFHIDGVMPEANRPLDFGQWRRLILDFVDRSPNESEMQLLLPRSAEGMTWWKQAAIARDVGRGSLRIHGTGRRNNDPNSIYYPHKPTSGCISQRELMYDGVEYIDQRLILNQWMIASGLEPVFANETRIKGLLYVIEINDERRKVTPQDLEAFGIR